MSAAIPSKRLEDLTFDDGFIRYVVCFRSKETGLGFQIAEAGLCGIALELLEMLRPEFPGWESRIVRFAGFSDERAECEPYFQRIKETVIELRDVENPGREFLRRIGYRADSPASPEA